MFRVLHVIPVGLSLFFSTAASQAGVAEDLVFLHIDAIGGQAAVDDLKAMRKEGHKEFGERRIPITIWGAVPNHIRIETRLNEETALIQGYDGTEAWQVRVRDGRVQEETMTGEERRQFISDAWFWGPLSDRGTRGIELDYRGVTTINESRGFLIEVMCEDAKACAILIAHDTYQVTAKQSEQVIRGRLVPVLHQYSEFRPVLGVWLPHRIEMTQEDHHPIVTVLDTIVPNPDLPLGIFEKPEIE
ncbi:MAG: hypothetical protein DRP71_01475 [Verrucomicrobia bacterium]|nr:MAG: hypothetical protein DRP71_01475 [Verrucomicrobiota bacterium]